jgi:hypothetical protein
MFDVDAFLVNHGSLPPGENMGLSFPQFDPEILKNGSDEEQADQTHNWCLSDKPSVFVRWVPDELLPDERMNPPDAVARQFFGKHGNVVRIDFVPKLNEQGKKSGHMAFVHYDLFDQDDFCYAIAEAHPQPAEFDWTTTNRYGAKKTYKLKCAINTRPIAKVEFNNIQLTDMIQNLNRRLTSECKMNESIVSSLRDENANLRANMTMLTLKLASLERRINPVGVTTTTGYDSEDLDVNDE